MGRRKGIIVVFLALACADLPAAGQADRAEVQRAAKLAGEAAVVHVTNGTRGSNLWTTRLAEVLDARQRDDCGTGCFCAG